MTDFMYPRPQLVRDNWTSLNGTWNFAFDDDHRYHLPTDDIEWTHQINVPFAPESKASGIGDTGFHKVVWYRREFDPGQGEGRVMLHFGAVDYSARVWVNNVLVVEHEGGHTPFSADVTNALRDGGPQVLTVQVIDDPADLAKPRGKQD
ncbi:MAG: sugar-binding domain-containing protein [Telluria sp.]